MERGSYNIRQERVKHHVVFAAKKNNMTTVPRQFLSQRFCALGRGKPAADDQHVAVFLRHYLCIPMHRTSARTNFSSHRDRWCEFSYPEKGFEYCQKSQSGCAGSLFQGGG